ncbi:hypothetical protein ANCDUO_10068 [Ancylostoma duodenale]|uniref:Uncharacterized protein n=1 Tax=Ancylostoma duodenale TaxID=51022 RepID=A0A0C2DB91_9BILA|nr:hypothetical protein ANCDUO_10068 [Ancylostoma duodenale]
MYGLETDVIPPIPNQEAMQRIQYSRGDYVTRVGYSHAENPAQQEEFADDSFDEEEDGNGSTKEEAENGGENIASHYGSTDQYR